MEKDKLCPNCQNPLKQMKVDEVEVGACPGCGGIWLEAKEWKVLRLLGSEAMKKLELEARPEDLGEFSASSMTSCPNCECRIQPIKMPEVDRAWSCPVCDGVWLPDGGLSRLAGISEKEAAVGIDPVLLDRRTFWVGDRVTWTQAAIQAATAAAGILLIAAGADQDLSFAGSIGTWLLPVLAALALIFGRGFFYYHTNWKLIGLLYLLVWMPPVAALGVKIDAGRGTQGAAGIVSLFLAAMNLAGYYLARWLRKTRHRYINRSRAWNVVGLITALVLLFLLFGYVVYLSGREGCYQLDIGSFRRCQPALVGVYIMLFGVGTAISLGINYFMLHCLYDPKGLDVMQNSPQELYLKMMLGSLLLTAVAWALLFFLLPPVAGGGGGGGKKSSSSKSSSSRTVRTGSDYSSTSGQRVIAGNVLEHLYLTDARAFAKWKELGLAG